MVIWSWKKSQINSKNVSTEPKSIRKIVDLIKDMTEEEKDNEVQQHRKV